MIFFGILLDTTKMELRLPKEKLDDLLMLLKQWARKKKTTKRELLSLIGKLYFTAKVVPAGPEEGDRPQHFSQKTTSSHSLSARADIQWWQNFLPGWNGVSLMLQEDWEVAADLDLTTDASGTLGFGA